MLNLLEVYNMDLSLERVPRDERVEHWILLGHNQRQLVVVAVYFRLEGLGDPCAAQQMLAEAPGVPQERGRTFDNPFLANRVGPDHDQDPLLHCGDTTIHPNHAQSVIICLGR